MKKIILGADHGGYELKNTVKANLLSLGYEVTDVGTDSAQSFSRLSALSHSVSFSRVR